MRPDLEVPVALLLGWCPEVDAGEADIVARESQYYTEREFTGLVHATN